MTTPETAARAPEPSDAILTVPNLLSFFRVGLTPLFLWLALGPDRIDLAFIVAVVGLITDIVDGKIARRFGQVSKLGIQLDPLSDRLGIAAAGIVFVVHDLTPLWVVLAILGRDALLVLIGLPVLKARGAAVPPVTKVGKAGSFAASIAFGLFLASAWNGPGDPIDGLQVTAFAVLGVAVPLYWAAGIGYIRSGIDTLKMKTGTGPAGG